MNAVRQHAFPIKIVVFDNGALSFVELEMKTAGFDTRGTELLNPNFAKIAEASGNFGISVEKSEISEAPWNELLRTKDPRS